MVYKFGAALPGEQGPGMVEDKRHADGFFDHVVGERGVAFAPDAVVPAAETVIGGVDDERVFTQAQRF